jgi:hypothetical protein
MGKLISRYDIHFILRSALLLALPAMIVPFWLVTQFPSYRGLHFLEDIVFALVMSTLLALLVRWRVIGVLSRPVAFVLYFLWLSLVFSEGVSYYLQADTFNDRFFANLKPDNFTTGVHAFPAMIGGGVLLLLLFALLAIWQLRTLALRRVLSTTAQPKAPGKAVVIVVLVLVVLLLDSAPHRLAHYFVRYEHSFTFVETPQGKLVYRELNPVPTTRRELVAGPGRNVVILYMESLERMYLDAKVFPGLTPNLDRLREQGLDFSGFETFSGATYTIAGMFSSQCGSPLFSSPFAAFDYAAGNNNDSTTFQPKLVCLGDVLHAAGYKQEYVGGAPSGFSNKGLFYMLHGYDVVLGLQELEKQNGSSLRQEGWGLYDEDLFRLALERYHRLSQAGEPFNLTMITLDTHPPHGRPSPSCPRYAANSNDVLQSVHCTDYLVGKFIDGMAKDPGWKNTVVLVMSDHLAMRNDSEALYPAGYHRQPLLFFLNAGKGERHSRFYHMDIAPTVLSLMGVRSNATFLAGADRSSPKASDNPLVDNDVTDAVIRQALWSKASEFKLCKRNTLIGWTSDNGIQIGGREMNMADQGEPEVALKSSQILTFFADPANASLLLVDHDVMPAVLSRRGNASAFMISPLHAEDSKTDLFAIDAVGRHGATAHLGRLPRLQGLSITSSQCESLVAQLDNAKSGQSLDFTKQFKISTTPRFQPLAPLPVVVNFNEDASIRPYRDEIGWFPASPAGSWTAGDRANLSFSLPSAQCHRANFEFTVHPYLQKSRPNLDVAVMVNNKQVATWHFSSGQADVQTMVVPVVTDDADCHAGLRFEFSRPGAAPPPYPANEDGRPLQMSFQRLRVDAPGPLSH